MRLNLKLKGIISYYYSLGGTIRLYLLIRVSQVRDLYGLPSKTIPHPKIQTFLELYVTH